MFSLITLKLNTKGTFLIEVTVSILLIAILIAPLTILFGSTIKSFFVGRPLPFLQQVLNEAMEEIADNLRDSINITTATTEQVTFLNKDNSSITIKRNTTTKLIEKSVGSVITYIPYYNSPTFSNRVSFEDPLFSYLTPGLQVNQTHVWSGGSPLPISSVVVTLRGTIADSNFTLREIVTLRRKK